MQQQGCRLSPWKKLGAVSGSMRGDQDLLRLFACKLQEEEYRLRQLLERRVASGSVRDDQDLHAETVHLHIAGGGVQAEATAGARAS